jgi:hypothetical protein
MERGFIEVLYGGPPNASLPQALREAPDYASPIAYSPDELTWPKQGGGEKIVSVRETILDIGPS